MDVPRRTLGLFASLALACHPPAPETSTGRKEPPEAATATTTLERGGCSVELTGSWRLVAESTPADGSWAAERLDADENLTVLPMAWKAPQLETEWREDLGSVLALRREAEQEQGDELTFTQAEYWGDGKEPGAFYTSSSASDGESMITIAKASPELLCVFFLVGPARSGAELASRAHEVLPQAQASAKP